MCPSPEDLLSHMPMSNPDDLNKVAGYYTQDEDNKDDVLNFNTRVMKLMRGKLTKQDDWEQSEVLQLEQYEKQYMFSTPVHIDSIP